MKPQQNSESATNEQFYEITPEQFAYDITLFADFIFNSTSYEDKPRLYGVPRGGLIVAGYLAHLLKTEVISCPLSSLKFYTGLGVIRPQDLIIEDIYDTGDTYKEIRKEVATARVLHLYCKRRVPERFAGWPQAVRPLDLPRETFVRFPWEKIADDYTVQKHSLA